MDRASLEVAIGAGVQELSVGFHDSFKHNDRMRGGMSVPLCPKVGRIANQVVLGTRFGVVVEQSKADRPVIDDGLRLIEFERRQIVLQHPARLFDAQLTVAELVHTKPIGSRLAGSLSRVIAPCRIVPLPG